MEDQKSGALSNLIDMRSPWEESPRWTDRCQEDEPHGGALFPLCTGENGGVHWENGVFADTAARPRRTNLMARRVTCPT